MANPEFSFIYNVTIRQYKNESLFNDLESDETSVLVLANGLREATDKAEDYAESMSQDGAYKFYDVVAVEELDTVYTGLDFTGDGSVVAPEEPEFENPVGWNIFYVNSKTGEKIPVSPVIPENGNTTYIDNRSSIVGTL
jgi:hypothetical protein